MEQNIYKDIAERTDGNIYIGVVGPVRSGKSTLIKKFMDTLVLPHIENDYRRERAMDELPQSSAGRTIMTTEPKFIPEEAVEISVGPHATFRVRLIDCVGYILPSSLGYIENDQPRMVKTPWFQEEIPFNMAAEIGTRKVIEEHSTIGLVVTTDGSIGEIDRKEYEEAEERVIGELQAIRKPFVVLLNSLHPHSSETASLAERLQEKYGVPVMPVNCESLDEDQIHSILSNVLFEFPIREIGVRLPGWIATLSPEHWLRREVFRTLREKAESLSSLRQLSTLEESVRECEHIVDAHLMQVDLGRGCARMEMRLQDGLFYRVVAETTGLDIGGEQQLLSCLMDLAEIKKKYEKVRYALEEVEATGYGIVMPSIEELTLEEPEIVRQGGQYGVRLRAAAPSIHMMKASIQTEIAPTVGSEKQSEDLVMYLLKEFEEDTLKIWDSNIFGKSLHDLVTEGLHAKLNHMPSDARGKLQETLERVINEGCSGLICIIL